MSAKKEMTHFLTKIDKMKHLKGRRMKLVVEAERGGIKLALNGSILI